MELLLRDDDFDSVQIVMMTSTFLACRLGHARDARYKNKTANMERNRQVDMAFQEILHKMLHLHLSAGVHEHT